MTKKTKKTKAKVEASNRFGNWIVIAGTMSSGFSHFGPFVDRWEACRWADETFGVDWWVDEVHSVKEEV